MLSIVCVLGARLVHLGPLDLVEHKTSQYFKEVKIPSVMTRSRSRSRKLIFLLVDESKMHIKPCIQLLSRKYENIKRLNT